ncbi:trypsin-like peptidase domain-containing protein [Salinimonas marina]|uniref:Trypsin-like peptidase domain-containing protein n=1 Tax=Salinimonas marina TaxID=2785918 RepID=A0A7S9DYX4_9ALTE|nr:serine protease [Salinimonas marina]QPG06435.1 trypsin-like peptidase domain-containing protein [Salinimonas marina]
MFFKVLSVLAVSLLLMRPPVFAADLPEQVKKIKPAIVGVGRVAPLATVSHQLTGTGFVIGDGQYVVTNDHVANAKVPKDLKYRRAIFYGQGRRGKIIEVLEVYEDPEHDLAILKIAEKLPAVTLAATTQIDDGKTVATTGYPMGGILGLYAATHQGIIAAFTPSITAAKNSQQISERFLQGLRNRFMVYQLDIVAYPGNSGSPVYLAETGEVFAVINKVFVKQTKESAISNPSGITYAIPVEHVYALAKKHNIPLG